MLSLEIADQIISEALGLKSEALTGAGDASLFFFLPTLKVYLVFWR